MQSKTHTTSPTSFYRAVRYALLLLITLPLLAGSLAAQTDKAIPVLKFGKSIERELAGDQTHFYNIALTTGQYIRVVVDQRGIDVVVTLIGPDSKKLTEVDSPNGTQGAESVSIIVEATGNYRLEVHALEMTAPVGRYEVKIEELRAATQQDKNRHAAEEAFKQAVLLRQQGTAESLRSATKKYEESLALFRAVGDRSREAETLYRSAFTYYSSGETQKALDYLEQALLLFRAVGNRQREPDTLHNIGAIYHSFGDKRKALDYFNQTLPLYQANGDRQGEGRILTNIGGTYTELGERQKALDYYNRALSLYHAAGDRKSEGDTLLNIGQVYYSSSENQKALAYYTQALPLYRAAGDRGGETRALNNTGLGYYGLGEWQKALDYYNQALSLSHAVGDRDGEATALNNIGSVYDDLGEWQKALDYLNRALLLKGALEDRGSEARTLTNIGSVYSALGEWQKALDYFNRAQSLSHAVGDRQGESAAFTNIGKVYNSLGEQQKALDHLAQGLSLSQAVGDRRGEATLLSNLGAVYNDLGQKLKALVYYEQSLMLNRAIGNREGEAVTLNNIGLIFNDMGRKSRALDFFTQALTFNRAIGNREGEAVVLNNIGLVHNDLGQKSRALDFFTQALLSYRAVGDREGEAANLSNIAHVELDRGNHREALIKIEAALNIVESLRIKIGSQKLRASYFATAQDYYEFYIGLLMALHRQQPAAGYDGAALHVSERGRARSLLETLAEAKADIRQGIAVELLERERILQRQINAKAQYQTRLLNGKYNAEQAVVVAKELDALMSDLQQTEAQIRQVSPRYATLTQPQPLTLKEIQTQVLDNDTLLLQYSLGTARSYLWAVTPTSITSYELPRRAEIETVAREFYTLVNARSPQAADSAAELSRMLLAPAALKLGNKRLLIVSDGALQYIPFAALPNPPGIPRTNPSTPLVVRHEIVGLPSASMLAVLRREAQERRSPTKTLAVLADPVFERTDERFNSRRSPTGSDNTATTSHTDESRGLEAGVVRAAQESGVADAVSSIPRLLSTRREAEEIVKLVPPNLHKKALDFAASRATATDAELGTYRYVHFATHGFLNSQHPELSGIILSMFDERGTPQDGFLRAHEIFNLNLTADMVVLSACQTGLGKDIRGEGLVGLTRGFMYAGTPRVVVSLWNVDDKVTAELMKRFYQKILTDKLRPAQALQAAQLSLLNDRRFNSPFYWAAFTIQGEWR